MFVVVPSKAERLQYLRAVVMCELGLDPPIRQKLSSRSVQAANCASMAEKQAGSRVLVGRATDDFGGLGHSGVYHDCCCYCFRRTTHDFDWGRHASSLDHLTAHFLLHAVRRGVEIRTCHGSCSPWSLAAAEAAGVETRNFHSYLKPFTFVLPHRC